MSPLHDESPAFQQALLRSERLRIFILFVALGLALLFRLIRTLIAWNPENASALLWLLVITGIVVLFESLVLRAVDRAIASGTTLRHPAWMLNILLETVFPAAWIAFLPGPELAPEFRPLANPAFLLYFVLITLTTLRLKPSISVLCGATSLVTYVLAAISQGWSPRWILANASLFAPEKIVSAYAVSILIAALAAALVAKEIRNQVEAALREAEMRREVEHLEHDLDVARGIQQSLLPKSMPNVPGFDLAAWNKPADQTGGDYYDWHSLPGGRFLIAMADVTGHGIGPALLAAVCRAYSRATFGQYVDFLSAMEQINTAIAADVGEGRFITFVGAIVGPASSKVELLSAGHAPLFLYWLKHDRFDEMEAQGLPLGILPEFTSEPPQVLDFGPGDLLVLATDGFFEWANASEELFGSKRLENSIRANRDKPAAEIISALYQDVILFSGGTPQKDDLTAIVIKRN